MASGLLVHSLPGPTQQSYATILLHLCVITLTRLGLNPKPAGEPSDPFDMPGNGLAVAGVGSTSLATLLLRWAVTSFFTRVDPEPSLWEPPNCQPFVEVAAASARATLDSLDSPATKLLSHLVGAEPDRFSFFLLGIAFGLLIFPLIDLLFVAKTWWTSLVSHLLMSPSLRPFSLRPPPLVLQRP